MLHLLISSYHVVVKDKALLFIRKGGLNCRKNSWPSLRSVSRRGVGYACSLIALLWTWAGFIIVSNMTGELYHYVWAEISHRPQQTEEIGLLLGVGEGGSFPRKGDFTAIATPLGLPIGWCCWNWHFAFNRYLARNVAITVQNLHIKQFPPHLRSHWVEW